MTALPRKVQVKLAFGSSCKTFSIGVGLAIIATITGGRGPCTFQTVSNTWQLC